MYKTLLLLKSSDKEQVSEFFTTGLYEHIKDINGVSSNIGRVENSLLLPESYQKVIEIVAKDKIAMENALMSLEGKKFSKALQNFHTFVTIISFEYE